MSKYFWPASALEEADMKLLYRTREESEQRIPITQLIAHAVRATYGHAVNESTSIQQEKGKAA